MLKNKRPTSYDVFKSPENQNKKRKTPQWSWKLVWKWFKAFLYVFAFGITLTGCIQSFAISSDTTVSSTVEFFNNKESIAPRTVTLVPKSVNNTDKELNGIVLSQDTTTQLNGNDDEQRKIIQELTNKTEKHGGTYGTFGSYTAFVRFQNSAGFHNKVNDQYLFFSSTQKTYTSVYGDFQVSANNISANHNKPQWTSIPIPIIAYNEGIVADQDPKVIENSKQKIYYINNTISPLVDNLMYSTFARDVIQATYDRILKLEMYKDGKLINAIDDVNANGLAASVESRKLVNNYRLGIQPILNESQFTLADDDNKTVEFNYQAAKENSSIPDFPFKAKHPLKPIISWSDAWGYGPFYGLIIFPLAKLMNAIISSATLAYGWGVFIAILVAVLLTRLFTLVVGWKSHFVQSKQVEMNARKAKIEAKYAQFKGNKEMENRKRREIAELHKKYGFNLSSTFSQIAITTPIFIAMWKTVQSVQIFKTTNWAGLEFAQTSWREALYNGQYQYLWIIICVAITSILAQIVPRILNRKKNKRIMNDDELMAYKKQQKTQNIITVVFAFFAVILQSGVQVYWMMGNLWMIGQSIGIYYFQKSKYFKEKLAPRFFKKNN